MTATVDANVLLYASNEAAPQNAACHRLMTALAEGPSLVHLFWPVAMAYLRISTHPRIFARPLTLSSACARLDSFVSRPHVRCPGEGVGFWRAFQDVVAGDAIRGNLVPDAYVAALMREHGVGTIWTSDRDFRRFAGLTVRDPETWTP